MISLKQCSTLFYQSEMSEHNRSVRTVSYRRRSLTETAVVLTAVEKKVAGFQKIKYPQSWVLLFTVINGTCAILSKACNGIINMI